MPPRVRSRSLGYLNSDGTSIRSCIKALSFEEDNSRPGRGAYNSDQRHK